MFIKILLIYEVFTIVRMHLAHTTLRTFLPPSYTVTACKLGRKVRLVLLLDHGRFFPKVVVLPQFAHFAIINFLSQQLSFLSWGQPFPEKIFDNFT